MGSSLRAPFLKALLVGGALLAASVAFAQDEAAAEPVVSSWYGPGFEGAITASGEPFDPYGYTAASPYLPFGTRLYVCYRGCVTVQVNDRGPYVYGRELDLSQAAAEAVRLTYVGVDVIDATVLGYGPS